jgi:multidrug efflux pump subunit AcrB
MPVIQMGLASDTLSEQALFDVGNHFIRTQLATVQGTALPRPYGGKQGLISVDLDTTRLQATGLTPLDIVTAIGSKECHGLRSQRRPLSATQHNPTTSLVGISFHCNES